MVFLDTYEALWADAPVKTGLGAAETDAWVRDLVASTPGVLFVILGRERLTWDRRFPDQWAGLLDDQHLLGGLSARDADWFLGQVPIADPALRQAIIDGASAEDDPHPPPGASGAHPFYLDLAVDTWQAILESGRTPVPADFGATHPEARERFLRHRGLAEREALKVLAGPAAFDRELFEALNQHFATGYPPTAFEDLCDLSIIEPGADGRLRLHALMREHLLAALEPTLRGALDGFLFDWFDARCQPKGPRAITPGHETALREAVAHRDTGDPAAALGWFWQRWPVFYDAARHALLEPLCRRALALAEARLGADHPETAVALNNLAELLRVTNCLAEAERLMRRALAIDEASVGPEHPKVATRLNNLAQLLEDTNRLAEAEDLMRRALAIDEASYGPEHPKVAIRLSNLSALLQATNRLAEAEPLMRRALAIDEASYGPEHPEVATRLNNLAQLLQDTNRLAEAEEPMRRALAIWETSLGPEHPKVAIALNNLAQLLKATNRLAEAEPLMRRALAIDEASFGPEHPEVARDLNNLAALFQATNRLAEAEPLSRRMLLILLAFTRDTGHRHPKLPVGFANYRELLAASQDPAAVLERLAALGPAAGLPAATSLPLS